MKALFRSTMRPGYSDVYFDEPPIRPEALQVRNPLHYRSKAAALAGAERRFWFSAIAIAAVLVFMAGIAVGALVFSKLL